MKNKVDNETGINGGCGRGWAFVIVSKVSPQKSFGTHRQGHDGQANTTVNGIN